MIMVIVNHNTNIYDICIDGRIPIYFNSRSAAYLMDKSSESDFVTKAHEVDTVTNVAVYKHTRSYKK